MPTLEEYKKFLAETSGPTKIIEDPLSRSEATDTSLKETMVATDPAQQDLRLTPNLITFKNRNELPGVPLDMETGVPASIRAGVALRRDPVDKLKFLNEQLGNDFSRLADTGEPIARVIDEETGQAKDVLINTEGFNADDLIDLVGVLPELVGSIGGLGLASKGKFVGSTIKSKLANLGKGIADAGAVKNTVASAVGAQTAGALTDIAVTDTMTTGEITKERSAMVPVDIFFDAAAGAAIFTGGKLISPFGGTPGKLQFDAGKAKDYFLEKYGVDYPLTIGEITGSPSLQAAEAHISHLPGGKGVTREILDEKVTKLQQLQNLMLGLPEKSGPATRGALIPGDKRVGEDIAKGIQAKVAPVKEAVGEATQDVTETATRGILRKFDETTITGADLTLEEVGSNIRTSTQAKLKAFRDEASAKYNQALSLPGGRDRIFAPKSLEKKADKILESLPGLPRAEVTEKKIFGPGEEVVSTVDVVKELGGREPATEFIPAKVVPLLEKLKEFGQRGTVSLDDLKNMRTQVDNLIAEGEVIPGVKTKHLTDTRELITSTMDEMVDSIPDKRLAEAWRDANKFYKEGREPFDNKFIKKILKDEDLAGSLDDRDIVLTMFNKSSPLEELKTFLGKDSVEFKQLKRSVQNDLFRRNLLPGEELIDGKTFVRDLDKLKNLNPKVYKEIFGSEGIKVRSLADMQSLATADKIDPAKLLQAAQEPGPMGLKIQRLISEQKKLDKLYRSNLIRQVGEGEITDLNAADFANRFFDSASREEVKEIKALLADQPETLNKIRVKTIEKIFHEAQAAAAHQDPSRLGLGEAFRKPGGQRLENIFGDTATKEKLVELMGKDAFNDFVELGKMIRVGEVGQSAFASAAGLAAGSQIAGAWRHGPMGYTVDWAKQRAAALLLATPVLRKLWKNTLVDNTKIGAAQALVFASVPFLTAATLNYGEAGARELVEELKSGVDKYTWAKSNEPGSTLSTKNKMDKFLQEGGLSPNLRDSNPPQ